MFQNGLLVLTSALVHQNSSVLPRVVQSSVRAVQNLLYVHLVNGGPLTTNDPSGLSSSGVPSTQAVRQYITDFYTEAARVRQSLEVRFIIGNILEPPIQTFRPQTLEYGYEVVLTDLKPHFHEKLTKYLQAQFPVNIPYTIKPVEGAADAECDSVPSYQRADEPLLTYRSVCLGGAFDRIHVGHRILLTQGCLFANESLTIGVTQGLMNRKKILNELMRSVDERMNDVRRFVCDIKPGLHYNIVPIVDVYGPAGSDGSLECIVVSQETVRGADAVNSRRAEQGMNPLEVKIIELVADEQHTVDEEEKVSSSSLRKRLLGTLIRPPKQEPRVPYIVGLTGGTASGKSSICSRLKGQGAAIIECDKLGHQSYEPGALAYEQIIAEFGRDILDSDGRVNRRSLAARVFTNKSDLEKLNSIVWPAIRELCLKEINALSSQGYGVIVLDAAVLLEAGWDDMVNEVWTTVISTDEAVKRLVDRNALTEDDALKRIESQMSNEQRISHANVVLCTLWHPDVTQKQVEKAWKLLQDRLGTAK